MEREEAKPTEATQAANADGDGAVVETSDAGEDDAPLEERVPALELLAEQAQAEAAARSGEASALRAELAEALTRYRGLLLGRDPDVPEELVQGESVAELEASFERAAGLVDRMRRRAAEQTVRDRVPAGAPTRRSPDSAALSPQQKILLGLQQAN